MSRSDAALDTIADVDVDVPTIDIDTADDVTSPTSHRRRTASFKSSKHAVKYSPYESCYVDVFHEDYRDKLQKPYKAAIASLVQSKEDSKRKKVSQAIEEFLYYFYVAPSTVRVHTADDLNALIHTALILISSLDEKKARFINLLLSDMRVDNDKYDRICIALKRELAKDNTLHKAYTLRTVDKLSTLSGKATTDLLRDTIAGVLKAYVKADAETKSRFKAALNIADKDDIERHFLVRTALIALQRHPQAADSSALQQIFQVTRSKDSDCAREALAALLILAGTTPQVIMPLKAYLPKFVLTETPMRFSAMTRIKDDKRAAYLPRMNVEYDAIACTHVAQLCSIVIGGDQQLARHSRGGLARALEIQQRSKGPVPSDVMNLNLDSLLSAPASSGSSSSSSLTGLVPPQLVTVENEEFVSVMKYMLHEENLLVFMETVRTICRRSNFALFFEKDVTMPAKKGAPSLPATTTVLEYVVDRISDSLLRHGQQVLVHAAARLTALLASCAAKYKAVYPNSFTQETMGVLYRLLPVLDMLLIHDCAFVRLQAYKAMLWLVPGSSLQYHPDDGSLISSVIERLKIELHGQVINNLWRPYHIHELLLVIAQHTQIDSSMFGAFSELCVFLFVNKPDKLSPNSLHISALFSEVLLVKDEAITNAFLKMIYTILDTGMRGSTDSLAHFRVLYAFLAEVANRVCKEPPPTPPVLPNTPAAASIELDADSLRKLSANSLVFDVHNPAMKTILLRLMTAAIHHTQEIRATCIEGLGKIAFRSLDPIRLFIYQFLSTISSVSEYGLSTQCAPILLVLDEVYKLQKYFAVLTSKEYSDSDLLTFLAIHERVKEKIGFFCKFPPSFLPLGLASRPYLTQAFDIYQRQQKNQ